MPQRDYVRSALIPSLALVYERTRSRETLSLAVSQTMRVPSSRATRLRTMPDVERRVRVWSYFVSSTFDDMQRERDILQTTVLPHVNAVAEKYGCVVEFVDLRWGLEKPEDREDYDTKVLESCLLEVDRCRPHMLAMLGSRYGWVPSEKALFRVFGNDARDLIGKSITELEIEYGSHGEETPPLIYIRRLERGEKVADPRQVRLRNSAREGYGGLARSYDLHGAHGEGPGATWAQTVMEDILRELEPRWSDTSLIDEDRYMSELREVLGEERQLAEFARGRQEMLADLKAFCMESDGKSARAVRLVAGASGTGKSSLMACLCRELEKSAFVLRAYCGLTPLLSTLNGLLEFLCWQLQYGLCIDDSLDSLSFEELREKLHSLLEDAARIRRVVMLVDGLDQLPPSEETRRLLWLPSDMPENVRCVLTDAGSISPTPVLAIGGEVSEIIELSPDDARLIIDSVSRVRHKCLPVEVVDALVSARRRGGSPLYYVLVSEYLCRLDQHDFERINRIAGEDGDYGEALVRVMLDQIRCMPDDVGGVYRTIVSRMGRDIGKSLVDTVLAAVALSRNGLRDSDISAVSDELGVPHESIDVSIVRAYLPIVFRQGKYGEWRFSHSQLRETVLNCVEFDRILIHEAIAKRLMSLAEDGFARRELAYHLCHARMGRDCCEVLLNAADDDPAALPVLCDGIKHVLLENSVSLFEEIAVAAKSYAVADRVRLSRVIRRDVLETAYEGTDAGVVAACHHLLSETLACPEDLEFYDLNRSQGRKIADDLSGEVEAAKAVLYADESAISLVRGVLMGLIAILRAHILLVFWRLGAWLRRNPAHAQTERCENMMLEAEVMMRGGNYHRAKGLLDELDGMTKWLMLCTSSPRKYALGSRAQALIGDWYLVQGFSNDASHRYSQAQRMARKAYRRFRDDESILFFGNQSIRALAGLMNVSDPSGAFLLGYADNATHKASKTVRSNESSLLRANYLRLASSVLSGFGMSEEALELAEFAYERCRRVNAAQRCEASRWELAASIVSLGMAKGRICADETVDGLFSTGIGDMERLFVPSRAGIGRAESYSEGCLEWVLLCHEMHDVAWRISMLDKVVQIEEQMNLDPVDIVAAMQPSSKKLAYLAYRASALKAADLELAGKIDESVNAYESWLEYVRMVSDIDSDIERMLSDTKKGLILYGKALDRGNLRFCGTIAESFWALWDATVNSYMKWGHEPYNAEFMGNGLAMSVSLLIEYCGVQKDEERAVLVMDSFIHCLRYLCEYCSSLSEAEIEDAVRTGAVAKSAIMQANYDEALRFCAALQELFAEPPRRRRTPLDNIRMWMIRNRL